MQSLYWSVLPHQTMPGDRLPLAITAVSLPQVAGSLACGVMTTWVSTPKGPGRPFRSPLAGFEQPVRLCRIGQSATCAR